MERIRRFFWTTVLGGVVVVLPVAILVGLVIWLYGLVGSILLPVTDKLIGARVPSHIVAYAIIFLFTIAMCFAVGLALRTKIGQFIHSQLEQRVLRIAPGYTLIKEIVMQFLGRAKKPFSKVALVRIFDSETLMTAFVTDEHENGSYTVFVPTGPNPTSGNIYHLGPERVTVVDVGIEEAMQSIIACGAGSGRLVRAWAKCADQAPPSPGSDGPAPTSSPDSS